MGKILKYEEIKKNEHVAYSECYVVNFRIKNENNIWSKTYANYFAKTKGEHECVENRWKSDYKNEDVDLINIIYQ